MVFIFIVALAYGHRLVIISDRSAAPNEISSWDPLPKGSDQRAYINKLHELQRGDFPPTRFFFQPGIVYFLGFVASLLQTTDLLSLRLFLAALASFNCGLVAIFTWSATGRQTAGLAAGLLLAIYPVSAFYDTDFTITSQALILATLMFGAAWLARRLPRNLFWPLLIGLAAGAGAITRFELVVPGFVCAVWLLLHRQDKNWLRQFSLFLLGVLLLVAPVALHNRAGGANYLITPVGPTEVYRGNNRDTDGLRSPSNAVETTHQDYFHYLLHDILLEPGRFIQLSLHKLAFFLSSIEGGNNLDFQASGLGVSPILAINPLNFPTLLILSLAGLLALWRDGRRSLAWLLLTGGGAYVLAVLLTVVESRLKTPVIIWMLPAAGYAIDRGIYAIRCGAVASALQRHWRWLAAAVLLLLAIHWGATALPQDVSVAELPASATPARLSYDKTLELVGWQVREQYSPRNTIRPFRPWVVSLYWRLLQPTEVDYSFSLKYLVGNEVLIAYDRPIGYVTYPRDFTSKLRVGAIYVEHIGLSYRSYKGPLEQTGQVELDVYPGRESHSRLTPRDSAGQPQPRPVIARPAVLLDSGRNRVATDLAENGTPVVFGDALELLGHEIPESGTSGEQARIRSAWRTGSRQIEHAYTIGVYLFHEGVFVANLDSPPLNGDLQTFSLLPHYHFDDEKWLTLPETTGQHELYIGIYNLQTMERLPLPGIADDLWHVGSINVRQQKSM